MNWQNAFRTHWTLPTVYVIGSIMVYMRMAPDVCAITVRQQDER